jgi:lysophospholipase L1-like esterase
VRNNARWYQLVTQALCDYEPHVRAYSPDVLILQYGINECVPRAMPMALHRHLFNWHEHGWRGHRRYKRFLRGRLWPVLRRYQRQVSRVLGSRTQRVAPGRYADELRYLITLARKDTGCLVLVLDVLPPGPSVEHWIPGIGRRRDALNALMRRVVADVADPDVRFVDTSHVVQHLAEDAAPDGVHLSDRGHRAVAEHLADEITEWLPPVQ